MLDMRLSDADVSMWTSVCVSLCGVWVCVKKLDIANGADPQVKHKITHTHTHTHARAQSRARMAWAMWPLLRLALSLERFPAR